ncbi:nucleotidyltransferase domain-containing protein, partial [Bacillus thuringiensis]|nr:nucleotidyltransferase domain-containing protein [Bacillus thuringiensis]
MSFNFFNSPLLSNKISPSRDKVNGFMLIGSVARGDAYPDSDLDFYILLEEGQ